MVSNEMKQTIWCVLIAKHLISSSSLIWNKFQRINIGGILIFKLSHEDREKKQGNLENDFFAVPSQSSFRNETFSGTCFRIPMRIWNDIVFFSTVADHPLPVGWQFRSKQKLKGAMFFLSLNMFKFNLMILNNFLFLKHDFFSINITNTQRWKHPNASKTKTWRNKTNASKQTKLSKRHNNME